MLIRHGRLVAISWTVRMGHLLQNTPFHNVGLEASLIPRLEMPLDSNVSDNRKVGPEVQLLLFKKTGCQERQ